MSVKKASLLAMAVLLLVAALLLLFWLLRSSPNHPSLSRQPHVVSYSTTVQSPTKQANPATAVTNPPKGSALTATIVEGVYNEGPEPLSLLALYRQYRQWRSCEQFEQYVATNPPFDAQVRLEQRWQNIGLAGTPDEAQVAAWQHHALHCIQLHQGFEHMDLPDAGLPRGTYMSEPHLTSHRLRLRLLQMIPKTPKEEALSEVLHLSHEWIKAFKAVLPHLQGSDEHHQITVRNLEEKLKQLRLEQQNLVMGQDVSKDPAAMKRFADILDAMFRIEAEIKSLLFIDEDALQPVMQTFTAVNDTLFQQLHSRDPDVFYEAHTTLERRRLLSYLDFSPHKTNDLRELKRPFDAYVPPEDVLHQALGLNNPRWQGTETPYAVQLYLCDLGADCGPDSEWVKLHCFGNELQINPNSCGLGLPDFLQQHHLSPNQWQDVKRLKQTMEELYASG